MSQEQKFRKNQKAVRGLVHEIIENCTRIEEIASSVAFFFSKIYDIEKDFSRRSKYIFISKQIVFLAIQKSKTYITEIKRNIEMLEKSDIIKDKEAGQIIQRVASCSENLERKYRSEAYEGIIEELNVLGKDTFMLRKFFRKYANID